MVNITYVEFIKHLGKNIFNFNCVHKKENRVLLYSCGIVNKKIGRFFASVPFLFYLYKTNFVRFIKVKVKKPFL